MFRKNTAGQFIHFQGVDATTGGIKSGVSWTIRRCIDGTFAAGGGTVTEDGSTGWYKCALSQADTNGNDIGFNFTGTGAVPQTVNIVTTAGDPTDGVRFGLTALPNAAAAAAGGLIILGSNNTAAITIGALTVGAISGTTLTFSGAVAFQSTFTVTTSTSLGALSCTTLTASGAVALQSTVTLASLTITGAVAFQSTWTVTGAVLFSSTFATTGTTTFNALTVTNALTVSGTTTLTGAVSLGSTLGVTGTTTLAALNTGAIGTGNVTITGTLSTSGTTTLNALTITNALLVSGATTLTGTVLATGASNDIRGITVSSLAANVITAASIAASALNGKGDWNTTTPPTASAIVTTMWTDLLASSDFSTASSIGALLKTDIDAAISSRSTFAGGAVASVTGNVGGNVVGTAQLDPAQAIGNSQTNGTLGAALLGMEAQSVGKWTIVGTTLTLYRRDGTTVVRTFTLDAAPPLAVTSRT